MSGAGPQVTCNVRVASPDEVLAQRHAWNALADRMHFPTPFASWEWITAWLEVFGREVDPLVLFVHRDGELIGILPLCMRRTPAAQRVLAGSTIEMLGAAHVGADHLDLIAAPANSAACALAIDTWLADAGPRWREWRCPLVTGESTLHERAGGFGARGRGRTRLRSKAPYLPISGTFEEYLQTLSSNERYKLRSRTRKLFAREGVAYCTFDRESREAALARLFELHDRRADEKAIVSSFSGPAIDTFHRALLEQLPWDRVVLRGLSCGGEVFAMFYGFHVGGRLFYFQLGYDPSWSDASPGLVLLTRTIQEAFDSGCVEYNFLQGDESFKQTWTKLARPLYECRYYPSGLRGNLSYRLDHARDWLAQRAAALRRGRTSPAAATVPPGP